MSAEDILTINEEQSNMAIRQKYITQDNKGRLSRLPQQYQELGIAEQIDFDMPMTDSLIANSVALVDPNYGTVIDDSEGKWSMRPSLVEKLVDILQFVADKEVIRTENIVGHYGFTATSAKRYLRQLTEFGYLEAHGGNKNRTYSKIIH